MTTPVNSPAHGQKPDPMVTASEPATAPALTGRSQSLLVRSLRLWRTRIGALLVLLLVLVAVFGPLVAPHAPDAFVGPPYSSPGKGMPLGTDYLGRDVLSRRARCERQEQQEGRARG